VVCCLLQRLVFSSAADGWWVLLWVFQTMLPLVSPQDFLEMVPLKEYTQQAGPLNLAAALPPSAIKPDLGPKSYIAYGRCAAACCFAVLLCACYNHCSSDCRLAHVPCECAWGHGAFACCGGPASTAPSPHTAVLSAAERCAGEYYLLLWRRELELEGEGDSVTKLHCDLSDAVNVLCHMQPTRGAPPATVRCGRGNRWVLPGCVRPLRAVVTPTVAHSVVQFCMNVELSQHVAEEGAIMQAAKCEQAWYLTMLCIRAMYSCTRYARCQPMLGNARPAGVGTAARAPCGTSSGGRTRQRCGTTWRATAPSSRTAASASSPLMWTTTSTARCHLTLLLAHPQPVVTSCCLWHIHSQESLMASLWQHRLAVRVLLR
jgi:hypothetical protein